MTRKLMSDAAKAVCHKNGRDLVGDGHLSSIESGPHIAVSDRGRGDHYGFCESWASYAFLPKTSFPSSE